MIVGITQYNCGVKGDASRPWDGAKAGHCFTTFISSEILEDTRPMMKTLANANYRLNFSDWYNDGDPNHLHTFRLELIY